MANEQGKLRALFDKLTREPKHKFPGRGPPYARTDRGVYVIYDPQGKAAHVGSTRRAKHGIRQRLRNHLAGLSSFVILHLNRDPSQLRRGYEFQCLVIADSRLRALLEAYAIGQLCPVHIGHRFDK